MKITTTAKGSGYYRVYLDDAEVSQHVSERQAQKSATELAAAKPGQLVYYDHDYRVDVVVVQEAAPEPPPPDTTPPPDAEPPPPPPSGALYATDFDGGLVGGNGFSWGPLNHTAIDSVIVHSGTKSLHFKWNDPGNANAEQRFHHPPVSEYWLEFYLYLPDGTEDDGQGGTLPKYQHYSAAGASNNNKFLSAWPPSGYSSAPDIAVQTRASPSPYDNLAFNYSDGALVKFKEWVGSVPKLYGDVGDLGRWMQIRIHLKLSSDFHVADGIVQIWLDGVLGLNAQGLNWWDKDLEETALQHGYLMGWRNDISNAGLVTAQHVFVDDLAFHVSDPGW